MEERKKPYEKPQIITEETFETSALACSKVSGGGCPHATRSAS